MNQLIKKYWNMYGDHFGMSILHPQYIKRTIEKEAIDIAKKYAKGKLIDIGCGRMPYRSEFEPLVEKYVGVDHPTSARLYKSAYTDIVYSDATSLPFDNNTFDIALNFQVLEYIKEPQKLFTEVYRVLKNGGILVLSSPFLYSLHDVPLDLARYSDVAIKQLAKRAGFNILLVSAKGGFFEFWLQSLIVYLLKRLKDVLKEKMSLLEILYMFLLILTTPFIVIISNSIAVITRLIGSYFARYPNYFPSDILLVAKKDNRHEKNKRSRSD